MNRYSTLHSRISKLRSNRIKPCIAFLNSTQGGYEVIVRYWNGKEGMYSRTKEQTVMHFTTKEAAERMLEALNVESDGQLVVLEGINDV